MDLLELNAIYLEMNIIYTMKCVLKWAVKYGRVKHAGTVLLNCFLVALSSRYSRFTTGMFPSCSEQKHRFFKKYCSKEKLFH